MSIGATAQNVPTPTIEPLGNADVVMKWDGVAGKTYFIQHSDDLKTWTFDLLIKSGAGQHEFMYPVTPDKKFIRLNIVDSVSANPQTADFDGDGLSSLEEIQANPQLNPTDLDTDNDGIDDGGLLDRDGDGIPTAWEIENGYDPLVPNTAAELAHYMMLISTSTPELEVHTFLR